jgi:ribose transport system permease protein
VSTDTTTTPAPRTAAPAALPRRRSPIGVRIARFGLPVILILEVVVFSLLRPEVFFTAKTLNTILINQSVAGIAAFAALVPLIIGEFDLSVGATLGLGAILSVGFTAFYGLPWWVGLLLSVIICGGVGLANGLLITRVGVNSFVTTLGVSTAVTGAVLWFTGGNVIYSNVPQELVAIGSGNVFGVPYPVLIMIVIALVMYYVLDQTPLGRYLYALGGSKEASRLSGLNVKTLTVLAFIVAGVLAGLAGAVLSAKLGSGNPTVGASFLLPAFAAVFLGATAFRPGTFNVLGTIFAVFVIATGIYGLNLLGVPFFVEPIFTGLVLVAAVAATRYLRRERV